MTWVACDLETTGLDFTKDTIRTFAWYTTDAWGVEEDLSKIKAWFNKHSADSLIWHNAPFDLKFLWRAGIPAWVSWDTMLAESILPNRFASRSLEAVTEKRLGIGSWKPKTPSGIINLPIQDLIKMTMEDVRNTYLIFGQQLEEMSRLGLLEFYLNNPLGLDTLRLLTKIEYHGIGLNVGEMNKLWSQNIQQHGEMEKHLRITYKDMIAPYEQMQFEANKPAIKPSHKNYERVLAARKKESEFNFGSPKQVLWLLKQRGFPCLDIEGKESTGKDVLSFYKDQDPLVNDLLLLRENEHTSNSFYKNWSAADRDGRLYPTYHYGNTKTFRLSCSNPALQQVPRDSKLRELFIPSPGYKMIVVDYSQIEPRLIAHYTQDAALTQVFREGYDLYEIVAREILNYTGTATDLKTKDKQTRSVAKEIALASFYGIGARKLAYRIKVNTGVYLDEAQTRQYLNAYFDFLWGVKKYKRDLVGILQNNPSFVTVFGRTLFFQPEEYEHLAFNKIIQNTGSDINLVSQFALKSIFEQESLDARCLHLVHDEAVFEAKGGPGEMKEILKNIQYYMADQYLDLILVPIKLEISIGDNWGCKK